MDEKLKAKWVKALLSGKYKQRKTMLHDGERYCCLGVLGRMMGMSRTELKNSADGCYSKISRAIGREEMHTLFTLNDDSDDPPFEVIAGVINEAL